MSNPTFIHLQLPCPAQDVTTLLRGFKQDHSQGYDGPMGLMNHFHMEVFNGLGPNPTNQKRFHHALNWRAIEVLGGRYLEEDCSFSFTLPNPSTDLCTAMSLNGWQLRFEEGKSVTFSTT
jgi:hypothetical protein